MRRFEVRQVQRVFSDFFDVDLATIANEEGKTSTRLCVERGDAVGVVVYDAQVDSFWFVRQFRYPVVRHGDPFPLEIAAGKIDPGETAEVAARREVEEELGFSDVSLVPLGNFYSSPGGMSERVSLFFAKVDRETRVGGGGIDGEDIELVELSRGEVWRILDANELVDGKSLAGLYKVKDRWEALC